MNMITLKIGIMIFNEDAREWQVWINHTCIPLEIYDEFEIRIDNDFYEAQLEDWHERIKLKESGTIFKLMKNKIYKIRYDDIEELVPEYY